MATPKRTDRDGAVVGKWGTCQGRRVRIWILHCPHPGCAHQASSVWTQAAALEAITDHLQYAHGEAAAV